MHHRPQTIALLLGNALLLSGTASASNEPLNLPWTENVSTGAAAYEVEAGATSKQCYDPANMGKIGGWPGCDGMLIVSREMMLREVSPINGGEDMQITHQETGRVFTYGDSSDNIFTGQVTNMGAGVRLSDDLSTIVGMPEILLPYSFIADIGYWDVSNVEDMSFLFGINGLAHIGYQGSNFNNDISGWDMRNVRKLTGMLAYTFQFDQPIQNWQLDSADDMRGMVYRAESFNQDLSGLAVGHIPEEPPLFSEHTDNWERPKPCWGAAPGSCLP